MSGWREPDPKARPRTRAKSPSSPPRRISDASESGVLAISVKKDLSGLLIRIGGESAVVTGELSMPMAEELARQILGLLGKTVSD